MTDLLMFLIAVYCGFCYGFMFNILAWAIEVFDFGEDYVGGVLFLYIFAPITAPFVYGITLKK